MGSLKSPCTTSYGSSTETIPLNCLVFEKIAFLHFGGRHKQMDRAVAVSRSRCRFSAAYKLNVNMRIQQYVVKHFAGSENVG